MRDLLRERLKASGDATEEYIEHCIQQADVNSDGKIDIDEFVHLMVLHLPDARIAADAEFVTNREASVQAWTQERAHRLLRSIVPWPKRIDFHGLLHGFGMDFAASPWLWVASGRHLLHVHALSTLCLGLDRPRPCRCEAPRLLPADHTGRGHAGSFPAGGLASHRCL